MHIAHTKHEFETSLFKPVNGRTFDGYVIGPVKAGIRVAIGSENYLLNIHGVFCLETKLDGKTWYTMAGRINRLPANEQEALCDHVRKVAHCKSSALVS